VKSIQERQSLMMKQQQTQMEMMLKQIQAQMESEMRMKNELVMIKIIYRLTFSAHHALIGSQYYTTILVLKKSKLVLNYLTVRYAI